MDIEILGKQFHPESLPLRVHLSQRLLDPALLAAGVAEIPVSGETLVFRWRYMSFDMLRTCDYASRMPTMLQVRNVPDRTHRTLKARAALAGLSLSDYVLRELESLAARPTREDLLLRLRERSPTQVSAPVAEVLARERHAH